MQMYDFHLYKFAFLLWVFLHSIPEPFIYDIHITPFYAIVYFSLRFIQSIEYVSFRSKFHPFSEAECSTR